MSGVQALVRLVLDVRRADSAAGLRTAAFVSGYEGSPLGGFDLELGRIADVLAEWDVVFRPGLNEELAATSVQGTQLLAGMADARVEGVTGFWYGKSPGLDRASDALRHANLMGTHPRGGAVAIVGDDPAAKSSTIPGASEALLADLGIPVLYPADPQEVLDLGRHAVALSRACGLWVGLKIATNVADGSGCVEVGTTRITSNVPMSSAGETFVHQPTAHLLQPTLSQLESSREGMRLDVALAYARANQLNRIEELGSSSRLGIAAAGKTYRDLRQALHLIGLGGGPDGGGIRLLQLAMVHPLDPAEIGKFAAGLDEIIVVEEKRGRLESAIKEILYGLPDAPLVSGKQTPGGGAGFSPVGELDADQIATGLADRLSGRPGFAAADAWRAGRVSSRKYQSLPLVTRTPYFCSGCPHNTSTKVPTGSIVGGGIGCHALVMTMPRPDVGSVLGLCQMGGEGAQWIGIQPFLNSRSHLLQNIGDGTFHHSGSLAVRAAVAAGVRVTYKLLYNSAVAMTGGQQPTGGMSVPALTNMLIAEGVRRIIVTTEDPKRYRRATLVRGVQVWSRDRLVEAQEELGRIDGVTVLIHDQECATELRRKRKRGMAEDPVERVVINERVCEGCGDCGIKSNCLSVQPVDTEFGRKTRIDQSSCNKDYSCLAGDCPSFVTVVPGGRSRQRHSAIEPLPADGLPEPDRAAALTAPHTTRVTGVGGTGVVTLSQVLTAAALLAGYDAQSLDQTGLAQKGGAVVSDVSIGTEVLRHGGKAAAGRCSLYLGCDLLVAAEERHLAAASPEVTVAVVSTSQVPTGAMIVDPSIAFPDVDEACERIRRVTRDTSGVFVDARRMSRELFGSDQFANMFLAGVAYQTGALPQPASAIEQAIELNGVEVGANHEAFRRGRQYIADPRALAAALAASRSRVSGWSGARLPSPDEQKLIDSVGCEPDSELERLVSLRVPDLVAYQNLGYARDYARFVGLVRERERSIADDTQLTEAVARHLYKLMAYKDEYEVARLSLEPHLEVAVQGECGPGSRVYYRLHPPLLRAIGLQSKVKLGPWFRPVFRVLHSLRALRGTLLDPFGHSRVRRTERQLITEYRELIVRLLPGLAEHYSAAVELAALPDMVRGYEEIKLASVQRYRARVAELCGGLALPVRP